MNNYPSSSPSNSNSNRYDQVIHLLKIALDNGVIRHDQFPALALQIRNYQDLGQAINFNDFCRLNNLTQEQQVCIVNRHALPNANLQDIQDNIALRTYNMVGGAPSHSPSSSEPESHPQDDEGTRPVQLQFPVSYMMNNPQVMNNSQNETSQNIEEEMNYPELPPLEIPSPLDDSSESQSLEFNLDQARQTNVPHPHHARRSNTQFYSLQTLQGKIDTPEQPVDISAIFKQAEEYLKTQEIHGVVVRPFIHLEYEFISTIKDTPDYTSYEVKHTALASRSEMRMLKLRDLENMKKFIRTAKVMSQLNHSVIPKIYTIGSRLRSDNNYYPFVIKELIDEENWESLLDKIDLFHDGAEPDFSSDNFYELMSNWMDVCSGMNYVHDQSMAHLRLNLSKVFVNSYQQIKITDWADCKRIDEESDLLQTMSKNKNTLLGSNQTDYGSDIYQLGEMLYQILLGENVWNIKLKVQKRFNKTFEQVIQPIQIKRHIPPAINAVCVKALNKEYDYAGDLYEDARQAIKNS